MSFDVENTRGLCRELCESHPQLTRGPWAEVFVRHDFHPDTVSGALTELTLCRQTRGMSERARVAAIAGEAFLIGLERLVWYGGSDVVRVVPPAPGAGGGDCPANAAG